MTERYLPIWGGAENQLMQLIPELTLSGTHIRVITRRWKKGWPSREFYGEVETIRLGIPGDGKLATLLFTLHVIFFCIGQRKTFDLMHSHGAVKMGALCSVISRLLNKKTVAKIATAGHCAKLNTSLSGRVILGFFKRSDAIIAMTDQIKSELLDSGIEPDRIVNITNGVDCDRFHPVSITEKAALRKQLSLPQSHIILLFSGRLVKRKGIDFVINTWTSVKDKYPATSLLILGSGTSQPDSVEDDLKAEVKAKNMEDILFLGESDKPEYYLQASDIFVFPSRLEGFPNAVMEAMSTGLAVLSSDIGGVKKLIEHQHTGLKFTLDNVDQFQQACFSLIESAQLRSQLGVAARNLMKQQYSFHSIAKAYMALYHRLID